MPKDPKNLTSDKADSFEDILSKLSSADRETFLKNKKAWGPLEALCQSIDDKMPELHALEERLYAAFPNFQEFPVVESTTLYFFHEVYSIAEVVSGYIQAYQAIHNAYHLISESMQNKNTFILYFSDSELFSSFQNNVFELFVSIKTNFPTVIDAIHNEITMQNSYYRSRFLKPQEPEQALTNPMLFVPVDGYLADYVKIQFLEGNPVLTDVLLDVMNALPQYPRGKGGYAPQNEKKDTKNTAHEYAVQNTTQFLLALSNPTLLPYLENPHLFFHAVGTELKRFYDIFETSFEPHYKKLLDDSGLFSLSMYDANTLRQLRETNTAQKRHLERLLYADFDPLIQREEDYMPDNRREAEHFQLRDQALTDLYSTLKELSHEDDVTKKEKKAREVVLKVFDAKSQIAALLTSRKQHTLRRDILNNNEYYQGKQGAVGAFSFSRESVPTVKMDEVIGASFDKAKTHLRDIIDTALYTRLMRATAPGGKLRNNIILIGSYGCGKTELGRAVCADSRVIGASVNVTDVLTAYMHESVNNLRRVYDAARHLYQEGNEQKPLVLVLDEFDSWFVTNELGHMSNTDMKQIETMFLQILDGMDDYQGIITLGLTNKPTEVPKAILRRFRYVDVVGQLTDQERATMLKMYLEQSLPVHETTALHYMHWAQKLKNAPGDVIRKVVDELHYAIVPAFIRSYDADAAYLEKQLQEKELQGTISEEDRATLRQHIAQYKVVMPADVEQTIDCLLKKPAIRMQIDSSRKVYREAQDMLQEIETARSPFGLPQRRDILI